MIFTENYVLSCCSTADLTKEHFAEKNISYVCFHYKLDGENYLDDLGESVPFDEFYKKLAEGAETSTSQVNVSEYLEYFSKFLEQGRDILHVTLSTGLSGTFNAASNAAAIAKEKYPDRKIYIVDSLGASSGYGLLMDKLAELRDSGMGIDELRRFAEENRLRLNHWFFSTDLKFYIRGGRISKTAGAIGTILGICPLLNMNSEGRLIPRAKIRPKQKVIAEIVNKMAENAENGLDYAEKCYISHSACLGDAKAVAEKIEKTFPKLRGKVEINNVGTTIGAHTGPGTVALFFWGKQREI